MVINDFGFLYTLPTKACVKAQELDYRNIKRLTRAALLRWILAQTRITRCLSVLLEVSFYVSELMLLVTCSYGPSGTNRHSPHVLGSVFCIGAKRCWSRLVSA